MFTGERLLSALKLLLELTTESLTVEFLSPVLVEVPCVHERKQLKMHLRLTYTEDTKTGVLSVIRDVCDSAQIESVTFSFFRFVFIKFSNTIILYIFSSISH